MKKTLLIFILLVAATLVSCVKPDDHGYISMEVDYFVNGNPLITDSLCYHNEAGNEYMITEIQWFISKVELQNEQGEWIPVGHRDVNSLPSYATGRIFYIDTNIPESQTLKMSAVPVGYYTAMRFTFGLDEEDNNSGLFSDAPESNMFWPEPLGGGYHYMKLNGRFVNAEGELVPLNTHLGIGQNADHTEFYQNYFTVEGPIDMYVSGNKENHIRLCMDVDNWFRNPNLYDFTVYGSAIMQNQEAQQALKENGQDVFTFHELWFLFEKDMNKKEIVENFNRIMKKSAPEPHFWSWKSVKARWEQHTDDTESDS